MTVGCCKCNQNIAFRTVSHKPLNVQFPWKLNNSKNPSSPECGGTSYYHSGSKILNGNSKVSEEMKESRWGGRGQGF